MENPADQPATNADLQTFKADVRALLREELQGFAKKDDLKPIQETLDKHTHLLEKNAALIQLQGKTIVNLQTKTGKIEETMATKTDVRDLISAVESVVPKGEIFMQKAVTHGRILDDHEEQLRKQKTDIREHDDRIAALESKGKE